MDRTYSRSTGMAYIVMRSFNLNSLITVHHYLGLGIHITPPDFLQTFSPSEHLQKLWYIESLGNNDLCRLAVLIFIIN